VSRRDIWRLDEVSSPSAANSIGCGGRSISTDDEIVQTRHQSAKRLLTRLLKRQGCPPKRMITDKLGSYAAARRQIMPAIEHRSHKGLKQPGRELSPTSATTRAGDAGLSISGRPAAVHHRLSINSG
jgi:transposase-like protein